MAARLAALALVLLACEPVDRAGLIVEGDVMLHQEALPVTIDCGDVDCGEALDAWQRWLGRPAFEPGDPARVAVAEGDLPPDIYGQAAISWDQDTGSISSCGVTLQRGEWWEEVLEHELGHCLGLDDDEYSIDVGSIMSVPTWPDAGLRCTDTDRDAILGALEE